MPGKRRLSYEMRLMLMTFLAGFPGSGMALYLLWTSAFSMKVIWTLSLFIVVCWLMLTYMVREQVTHSWHIVSNTLMAFREGDFSLRLAKPGRQGSYGKVIEEANRLGDVLREQRLEVKEAAALLQKVMAEVDVAVFAFDAEERLRLINRAGELLLGESASRMLGCHASKLQLDACLQAESGSVQELTLPGGRGQWGIRRGRFRQGGVSHQFLVLADLNRALHNEEREAWKRLVRVLGHEIRNSLTPIKSAAGTLQSITRQEPLPADWREDTQKVLSLIQSRSDALNRFITAYARLATLPPPTLKNIGLHDLVARVASLETRCEITCVHGPALNVHADPDQAEQALINITRNAADAIFQEGGCVEIGWRKVRECVEIFVRDDGPGVSNPANLFVPFFTTKPNGTGIGLVLSRQIAEAHGGSLSLTNREPRGCEAQFRIPLHRNA